MKHYWSYIKILAQRQWNKFKAWLAFPTWFIAGSMVYMIIMAIVSSAVVTARPDLCGQWVGAGELLFFFLVLAWLVFKKHNSR